MIPFAYGETVTRQRATTVTDPYSNTSTGQDWANPSELDIADCAVADTGSMEPLVNARSAIDSDFDVYLPPTAEVTARDRLVVRGLVCDVAGNPFQWVNPYTGWEAGLVVKVKIREG